MIAYCFTVANATMLIKPCARVYSWQPFYSVFNNFPMFLQMNMQSLPKLLNCCKLQFFTGNSPQYWSHLVSELRKQWFTMARTQEAILKTQHNQSLQFIRIQKPTCINHWFLLGYHFINLGSQHRKGLPLTCAEWYWGQYSVLEGRCLQRRGRIWKRLIVWGIFSN